MSHFLVTGGAGFIGSHLVAALLQQGHRVRVLDNFSTGARENLEPLATGRLEIMVGDVCDLDRVQSAVAGVDYVLHLAAIVSVQQSMADPVATHAVNVTGTLHLLQSARSAGVRHLVLASSCAVYGDNPDLPLVETATPRPLSPYAASKLAAELYCQTFARVYGLPATSLRFFNIYGPRQNPDGDYAAVIPRFAARMRAGQPPMVYGDGQQTRDFVYVADVVRALLLACQSGGYGGEVWNVASGRAVSLLDLIYVLNELLGSHLEPEFQPARSGDILHSSGDGSRLAAALGFRPRMSLHMGLARLLDS